MLLNSFFFVIFYSLPLFILYLFHTPTNTLKQTAPLCFSFSVAIVVFFFLLAVPTDDCSAPPLGTSTFVQKSYFFLSFCALFVDEDSYYCCCWRVRLVLEGISLMTGRVLNLRFVFIVVLVVVCAYLFARLLLSSMKFGCFFLLIFPRPNSIVVDTHARVQTRTSLRLCRFRRVM